MLNKNMGFFMRPFIGVEYPLDRGGVEDEEG